MGAVVGGSATSLAVKNERKVRMVGDNSTASVAPKGL